MTLNLDVMNDRLILEWMKKYTRLTDGAKNIMINIKKQVQSDLSLFYEMNKIILQGKGIIDKKELNIEFQCSNGIVDISCLYGKLRMEANGFRKVLTTYIEIYEQMYPIGTVVDLKKEFLRDLLGEDQAKNNRVVIAHRYVPVSEKRYIPYVGVYYPEGPTKEANDGIYFTPAAIERVVHLGYSDDMEISYLFNLKNKIIADMDMHSNAFMTREEYIRIINNSKVAN